MRRRLEAGHEAWGIGGGARVLGTAGDGGLGRGESACRSLGIDRSHRCLERTTKRGVSFEFEIGFGDAGMVGRSGERRGGCRGAGGENT
jgi:hypothetical protein